MCKRRGCDSFGKIILFQAFTTCFVVQGEILVHRQGEQNAFEVRVIVDTKL